MGPTAALWLSRRDRLSAVSCGGLELRDEGVELVGVRREFVRGGGDLFGGCGGLFG